MLIVTAHDSNIVGKIAPNTNKNIFNGILGALKLYHCQYEPETQEWVIPVSAYEELLSEVKEFSFVEIHNQYEVDRVLNPVPNIIIDRMDFTLEDLKVPPLVGKHPYEKFQLEDLIRLTSYNKYALFNEQGTGKSWVLSSAYDLYRKYKGIKKLLYITSSTGVYNAKKEIMRFAHVDASEITIGNKNNRRPFDLDCNIIIMNYRSFLLVSDEYQKDRNAKVKKYRSTPIPMSKWCSGDAILILDESHNVSNPKARCTEAIRLVTPYFSNIYIATGTPADKEMKYYSQLKMLDTALVHNLSFQDWLFKYYECGNRWSAFTPTGIKESMKKELQDKITPYSVRRFANEVLDIPDMHTHYCYLEMSDKHRDIYESFVTDEINDISERYGGVVDTQALRLSFPNMLASMDCPSMLLKRREELSHDIENMVRKFKFADHAKVEMLMDIIEDNKDEKIIIWTSHPAVGFELQSLLKKYNPLIINGEVPVPPKMNLDEFKESIVEKFKRGESNILIAGFQVLNTAVTMIECSTQIIFDAVYNYTEFQQALKRIHRAGQTEEVDTYYLIYDRSIDVARKMNLEGKDYVNMKFFTKEYANKTDIINLFNMEG